MSSKPKKTSSPKDATIEEIYQKKTPLEHILLRPDTYVGSIELQDSKLWVWDSITNKMVYRQIQYVPGLYKIFDEILVNAQDNFQRDKKMNSIQITIDRENGMISIWNNGKGIPVVIHQEHQVYVPELIFGQLLTSSNYDDSQKKVTGGRNGYGAKLTNVFSKTFIVETADPENKQIFTMEWTQNMTKKSKPKITKYNGKGSYTRVTFYPDLQRFGMNCLDKDIIDLMTKRAYDMAGCIGKKVKIFINDFEIPIKSFEDYVGLYLQNEGTPKIYSQYGNRWEIAATISDGTFQQVSFVNGICTSKGGTHVNHITDQLIDAISAAISKKHKKIEVKNNQIKQHLWVFINCLIENPCFDSQTKENMTLKPSNFGSKCEIDEQFLKNLIKCGIIESIVASSNAKAEVQLGKIVKSKKNEKLFINKLEDANLAGTSQGNKCSLILTEGDSAKALAMAGIEVLGRDKYGVFPLKGKLLNVREASHKQLMGNEEIQNIMKIVGLQPNKEYTDVNGLRYGSIMIMADQDLDGSHIKGLIINFIHFFWPSLLKKDGFLKEFITPIVKATNGSLTVSFFTINEFSEWLKEANHDEWTTKYYKGLGTSTSKEAKEYFSNLGKHQIDFSWENDTRESDAIDMAFSKARADDRKKWLANLSPETYLDMNVEKVSYYDFIHKELVLFSNYDNIRSIPSLIDGLKPGQRKIIFACFKRKLSSEIKVAQLAGYVAEHSAYHHGEQSLAATIVGLSQNFVGSNNLNLLVPIGQFGTRAMGGKDNASPRYIFTNLSDITRKLFIQDDDNVVSYQNEEGQRIEPYYYVPVIPTVLVNGAEGIGTGWSTFIAPHNPIEIINSYRKRIEGCRFEENKISPWFRGFTGTIENVGNSFEIRGKFETINEDWIRIAELPIGKWTSDYKSFLESLMQEEDAFITEFKEYHTDDRVEFHVCIPTLTELPADQLMKKLKLISTLNLSNLVLFDRDRKIHKYSNVYEIMEEHFNVRADFYQKRKDYLVAKLTKEVKILSNKVRFINALSDGEISVYNRMKTLIVGDLKRKDFMSASELDNIFKESNNSDLDEDERSGIRKKIPLDEYDYLLNLPLWSFTFEKVRQLKAEEEEKSALLEKLINTTIFEMWIKDLDDLQQTIESLWNKEENSRENQIVSNINKRKRGKKDSPEAIKPAKKLELNSNEGKKAVNKEKIVQKKLAAFIEDKADMDIEENKEEKLENAKNTLKISDKLEKFQKDEPQQNSIAPIKEDFTGNFNALKELLKSVPLSESGESSEGSEFSNPFGGSLKKKRPRDEESNSSSSLGDPTKTAKLSKNRSSKPQSSAISNDED
ncbi:unnamed protein product [Blepharisma stoltei]|uniref:DNA topoisomerase 2 n=1 Tax=Blepharisma stoltei TaxID=1481888 RepID=A0AAU9IV29_9CILI|nr:unnamed protein product [Blepharisma stoltei]